MYCSLAPLLPRPQLVDVAALKVFPALLLAQHYFTGSVRVLRRALR